LVVSTQEDNVGIEFHDVEKRGGLPERVLSLIDALEQEAEPQQEESIPAAPTPEIKPKKKKIKKKIRNFS
ncbi:MAG: hypothetical protein ACP5I1_14995, partial [Candidatus Hinthialibacter sp.]